MAEIQNKIAERIEQMERGAMFFPADFADISTSDAHI